VHRHPALFVPLFAVGAKEHVVEARNVRGSGPEPNQ
jgi:hypothetical protein